ncbi:unnamed protein product [Closterium sp. NIES-64]|nr:unnamed protein product [Closterium sp. NIES-64]
MATPNVLTFDAEGRAIDFAVWIEDLQLYLLCDAIDEVSLFDFVSGAVPARLLMLTLLLAPSGRPAMLLHVLLCVATSLPLSVPTLVITHLRASDTRYRAALPAEFRAANPPPMYITLYFLVTRLPESLRVVRDQFLSVCPTTLTVDLLEEGVVLPPAALCRLLPLRPTSLVLSRSARRLPPAADAALARARGARGRVELEGAVEEAVGVEGGVGVAVGVVAGVEVLVAAVEAEVAAEVVAEEAVGAVGATVLVEEVAVETGVAVEAGGGGGGGGRSGSSQRSSSGGGQRQQQQQQQQQQQPQQQQRSRTDVTFDESVPYYRLFPYRTPSLPPPPLFLVPGPPPVVPLPPQGPAPSGVSQVDAVEPVEVTGDSGAAAGAEPEGAESGGAEPGGTVPGGAEPGGVEPGGAVPGGAEPGGAEPGGAEPGGAEPGGAEPGGAVPGGAEPGGAEPGGAVPGGASSRREPLPPQELREWFARRWRRAAGAGGSSAAEGTAATRPGGARTVGAGAAGSESSPGAGPAEGVGAEPAVGGPTDSVPGAAAGGSGASGGSAGGAAGVGAPDGAAAAVPAVSG